MKEQSVDITILLNPYYVMYKSHLLKVKDLPIELQEELAEIRLTLAK